MKQLQVHNLHRIHNRLQRIFGDIDYCAIHGAGCTKQPRVMFVFMNPTAANISSRKEWKSLRAPWLGTKNIWKLFYVLGGISKITFREIQEKQPHEWTPAFAHGVYQELAQNKFYITNLAKCTQKDAHPLPDRIFKKYLPVFQKEIMHIQPKRIVTFGNQVSSILLHEPVRVSTYKKNVFKVITVETKKFRVYPTYYPVGQGMRNMPAATKRIRKIISS